MSSEVNEIVLKKVANLLAVATIYAETPTFTDRMANSLSKESVVRSIYDAERIVSVGKSRGEIMETTEVEEGTNESRPIIVIKEKGKIYGTLPNESDISEFLDYVERDIYLARKVGAIAMSIVNKTG
ncbi:MAG: type I-A CRISPR-associated protein Csa5 [Sulfolobaceae archaeon]|nr:type I-A CRISPR-associated protein Csa5 [Sulfolobaceae archaeon]